MSNNSEHSPRVQARVPKEIKNAIQEALDLINAERSTYYGSRVKASDLIVHGLWLVLTGLGIDVKVDGWRYEINSELRGRVPIIKDWVSLLENAIGIDASDVARYGSSKTATDAEYIQKRLSDMETRK